MEAPFSGLLCPLGMSSQFSECFFTFCISRLILFFPALALESDIFPRIQKQILMLGFQCNQLSLLLSPFGAHN